MLPVTTGSVRFQDCGGHTLLLGLRFFLWEVGVCTGTWLWMPGVGAERA